jgi:hypothetical protein
MFCSTCGKKPESGVQFCHTRGIETKRTTPGMKTIDSPNTAFSRKTKGSASIRLIAMAVVMSTLLFLVLSGSAGSSLVEDKNVDLAISALTLKWKELFQQKKAGNGYLEIAYTRVLEIDPSANAFISSKLYRGDQIEYIVEFVLFSDSLRSAPYYHNENTYHNVIIYRDRTTRVEQRGILRMYTAATYKVDYSDFVKNIINYGTAFNRTIAINE